MYIIYNKYIYIYDNAINESKQHTPKACKLPPSRQIRHATNISIYI